MDRIRIKRPNAEDPSRNPTPRWKGSTADQDVWHLACFLQPTMAARKSGSAPLTCKMSVGSRAARHRASWHGWQRRCRHDDCRECNQRGRTRCSLGWPCRWQWCGGTGTAPAAAGGDAGTAQVIGAGRAAAVAASKKKRSAVVRVRGTDGRRTFRGRGTGYRSGN